MKSMVSLDKCLTLINHGPAVLIGVGDIGAVHNCFAVAWMTPVEFTPPTIMIAVAEEHFSHAMILESGEFTVNIPNAGLLKALHYCGTVSGRDHDKWKEAGLTPIPGRVVKAPLIDECIGHLECKVVRADTDEGGSLFYAEVVAASAREELYDGYWLADKPEARTLHHLGGDRYAIVTEVVKA